MALVERLRKVFRGKDDEIARLTRLNESLTEHNKLLAGNAREASDKCSRLTRENKRIQPAHIAAAKAYHDRNADAREHYQAFLKTNCGPNPQFPQRDTKTQEE